MVGELSAAPVLSTPAENAFEFAPAATVTESHEPPKTDDEVRDIYEIARTAREIREGAWERVALQFPDHMLKDGPRVVQSLNTELESVPKPTDIPTPPERIYILADTSYSACCVDEIAAEHVDADVVVHYGRSCLSPTSRLPVIYVFTHHALDHDEVLAAFEKQYPSKDTPAVLMADVTYQSHLPSLASALHARGYTSLLSTTIIHDPTGTLPNRSLVTPDTNTPIADSSSIDLKSHSIFHISNPPTALLLALASRVQALHIHPTPSSTFPTSSFSTPRLLGRRYARLLTLASAGIIGILVNTLSVSNYLSSVDTIRRQIAAAGKKSYTVVVGKLNPAKLANFAEVEGWVVVGCWESSLVEDEGTKKEGENGDDKGGVEEQRDEGEEDDSEEESAPPEFDLRTGRLISTSMPMRNWQKKEKVGSNGEGKKDGEKKAANITSTLALRPKAELAAVNGVVSPGAEYLRSQRTWQGLGSDYTAEESTAIEEGRGGIARGYAAGEGTRR
ncbi:Diphthamide biosynthesis protein 2 [Collariella sp. IMI 366227]|nr:Diphthamide biosynthesis protein 2 [Collariella sp. IMI 366227]